MRVLRERLRRSQDQGRDTGMTLVELIVAMGIFTIVIAVFMGAMVTMSKNTARAAATSRAGDELRVAFQRLDKQVRYADAINFPGAGSGGKQYVEFRIPAVAAPSGVVTCVQWRWDPTARTLAMRTWPQGGTVPAFVPMVRSALQSVDRTTSPPTPIPVFVMTPANSEHPRQALDVAISVNVNANAKVQSTSSSFIARNSTTDSDGNADSDANGVSDRPACNVAGLRP
ncbi:type II secretion system protein J [Cellulomonas algicola]|uniref:Prepilin-type N-terminal cleavage/methylation domain-containing protein n=1 Tax=Cellulomonas algicola TaxID=2071633 RepID=A0A401V3E1_9CELL|nr:type II secretion system protein [Cellulomonas algicola]GCD21440.1 hypothetical protein CTKZ_30020 [Cellulomonas algicola]